MVTKKDDEKEKEEKEEKKDGPTDKEREKSIWVSNGYMDRIINQQNELVKSFQQRPIPPRPSYWIARALDKMESMLKTFTKKKQGIVEEYSEKDDDGKPITNADGSTTITNIKGFMDAVEPYAEIELDLGIKPIEIDLDYLEAEKVFVPPGEWKVIMPLLKLIEP